MLLNGFVRNFDIPYSVFERGFQAAGRSFRMLKRHGSDKESFKAFICEEINAGRPVIALGVVGPPEACVIAGYKENGETLLGWSFFQKNAEFKKGVRFHENGYFITKSWWENESTILLLAIGEEQSQVLSDAEILKTAIEVMTYPHFITDDGKSEITCGQNAYNTWAEKLTMIPIFHPTSYYRC